MIRYHAAFDVHHAAFRQLVILSAAPPEGMEIDKLHILDFYLVFPREISTISLSPLDKAAKKKFSTLPQYESIGAASRVFFRLTNVFRYALGMLELRKFVTRSVDGRVFINPSTIPEHLKAKIAERTERSGDVLRFLIERVLPYSTVELKKRTGLQNFKYNRE